MKKSAKKMKIKVGSYLYPEELKSASYDDLLKIRFQLLDDIEKIEKLLEFWEYRD